MFCSICLSLCQYHTFLINVMNTSLPVLFLLKISLIILGLITFDWGLYYIYVSICGKLTFYNIESANLLKCYIHLCLYFSVCLCFMLWLCLSFVTFILIFLYFQMLCKIKYFSVLLYSYVLLICRNITDFCIVVLYSATMLNSLNCCS